MDLEHISLLMEFLKSPITPIKGEIINTLNRTTIKTLLQKLDISNSRIYIYDAPGRKVKERQLLGEPEIWKVIDIDKVSQETVVYKNYHFVRIQYSNNEGRLITLGFLGVYRKKILINSEFGLLQLFCRLYGDHIRKRMGLTFENRTLHHVSAISKIAYGDELPGTKISKTLESIHRAANAYSSFFCILNEVSIWVDYVKKSNSISAFFPKTFPINGIDTFIKSINKKPLIYKLSDKEISPIRKDFIRHDKSLNDNFLVYVYPAFFQENLLGCWILTFSDKQYFNSEEVTNTLQFADSLINLNYKFLYQRKTQKMVVNPIFKSRDTRVDNKKIFVLMPFTLDWSNRIWQQMIKETIENNGYEAKRADDLYGQDIVEDIWGSILSAHLIIADITSRNANVFYELGIAHTLGKKVILLSQDTNDIPFDLNRYRHIIYQDNFDGYEVLKKKLDGAIKELGK